MEIQNTKEVGGLAVAVASDEANNGSGRFDEWKRQRLLGVGADVVIPDYRDAAPLLERIFQILTAMNADRFEAITAAILRNSALPSLAISVWIATWKLIRPGTETSIETGLPVYNVTNVRAQPGGAGTVLNNLIALGMGTIYPVGFAGEDGEGYELCRALAAKPGVRLDHFIQTGERHTFTYCKPLILEPGKSPRELNRLDQKNWTPTPAALSGRLSAAVTAVANAVDALALLGQVDEPETGVLTTGVLATLGGIARDKPEQLILADNRHSLRGFPPVVVQDERRGTGGAHRHQAFLRDQRHRGGRRGPGPSEWPAGVCDAGRAGHRRRLARRTIGACAFAAGARRD